MPILTIQGQLLPLIFQSMDEDWYQDTRKLGCCTLAALLKLAGGSLTDDARRQIYPELVKRMDDSSNEVRISAAGAIQAFACDAMPPAYCDTNSGCALVIFSKCTPDYSILPALHKMCLCSDTSLEDS